MKLRLYVTAVAVVALGIAAPRAESTVEVPFGSGITVDGGLDQNEWHGAVVLPVEGGPGRVLLKHDGKDLLVGISGSGRGWSHLAVTRGDEVVILHASAALGQAVFRRGEDGKWNPSNEFDWALRNIGLDEDAEAQRTAYHKAHGWVASTVELRTPNHYEYRVSREVFADGTLSLIYATDADSPIYWPAGLDDDVRSRELVFGNLPPGVSFDPATWSRLTFQPEPEPDPAP